MLDGIAMQCAMDGNGIGMMADEAVLALLYDAPAGRQMPGHDVGLFVTDVVTDLHICLLYTS